MIVRMAKVQVLGPRRLLPEAILFLQEQGVLQLRTPSEAASSTGAGSLLRHVPLAPQEEVQARALGALVQRIEALLARLAQPRAAAPGTSPAAGENSLPSVDSPDLPAALERAESDLSGLAARRAELSGQAEATARLVRLLEALAPLRAEAPRYPRAETLGLTLRRDRPEALDALRAEVGRLTGGRGDLRAREAGPDELAVLLTLPRERAGAVASLLFEHGVEEIKLPEGFAGLSPARTILMLLEREAEIPADLAALCEEEGALSASLRPGLEAACSEALARLGRLEALARCGETEHAFTVAGWLPRSGLGRLGVAAALRFDGRLAVVEHLITPGDEVPVVLSNPPWLRPFELLLGLVELPRYGSTDPTPWMAVFFPLFFGLMLGDAGFGLLAMGLSALLRARGVGGETGRSVAAIAFACGASAFVFGILFGEAFGGIGEHLGLRPLLMSRRVALLAFMGVALSVGLLHLALGMVLGIADAARQGHRREVVARASRLGVLLAGPLAILAAAGRLPRPAGAAAVAVLAVSAGVGLGARGPMVLLDWVLAAGNLMSYTRLMALGLASLMLAEVANGMAAALPGPGGLALGILLHAVNFTLGLVSPAVAALRLQYVEFFEKFYREGGSPFRPFGLAQ